MISEFLYPQETAMREAETVIDEADHVKLSARDSLRVLDLLENSPAPNAKLLAAAKAMPRVTGDTEGKSIDQYPAR